MKAPTLKTKDIKPRDGEMVKPGEIIGIEGFETWKLSDRRMWNQLLLNAWGDRLEDPGATFQIPLKELRRTQESNARLGDSLTRLQKTVVFARLKDGTTTQVQMLGGANFVDDNKDHGQLRYNFNPMLVPILRDSEIYARMETKVLTAMTSKYSLALYEEIALRIGLRRDNETITLERLRHMLSVPEKKLQRWPDLNRYAVMPAMQEVNKLSPFTVSIEPIKTGKTITHVKLTWSKDHPFSPNSREAALEVNRHSAGRKARISGTAEEIVQRSGDILKAAADNLKRQGLTMDWSETHNAWLDQVRQLPETPADLDAHFIAFSVRHNGGKLKKDQEQQN